MKLFPFFAILLPLLVPPPTLLAQTPTFPPEQTVSTRRGYGPRRDLLILNQASKLAPAQIWVDRPVNDAFFVGEIFKVRLTLRNPTAEPLEVADPEAPPAGLFSPYMVSPRYGPTDGLPDISDTSPSLNLASGAEITIERWSDGYFHDSPQELTWFQSPTVFTAGTYELRSAHEGDALRLNFVTPRLVSVTVVGLPQTKRNPRNGNLAAPTFCRLYVLTDPSKLGEYYLYSDSSPKLFTELENIRGKNGLLDSRFTGAIIRVAKTNLPITSVTGTPTSSGLLLVTYTTSDGSTFSVALDSGFKPERTTVPPYPTPTLGISPVLECVKNNGNGSFNARFGYLNRNSTVVTVPVGTNNRFSPDPQDRGQVAAFQPGRIVGAFEVTWPGTGNLVWSLKGPDNQNRTATASSTSQACAP